ncbi:phosphoribosylpyrophosphate synthetase [Chitinophaga silvatica]|uniref:Phosphoribosylpyrophosphate synthetase n=1 Tax=Chitinophaga silvatica TaxID=2282649 RepID=A0A3E1Y3R9_9BACT|nr:phosphoribosylpyrophosphate synthetase [Chitinophaga silvatica]RFS19137.1 phosphoribosylpyrophosphate synthetase [Chitinophaga silvatica]
MKVYETVTEAINDLRKRGYTEDFNLLFDSIQSKNNTKVRPEDFEVKETYRFEGETDPGDEAVVYGIETINGEKGVLMYGFGVYSEDMSEDLIRKLK